MIYTATYRHNGDRYVFNTGDPRLLRHLLREGVLDCASAGDRLLFGRAPYPSKNPLLELARGGRADETVRLTDSTASLLDAAYEGELFFRWLAFAMEGRGYPINTFAAKALASAAGGIVEYDADTVHWSHIYINREELMVRWRRAPSDCSAA